MWRISSCRRYAASKRNEVLLVQQQIGVRLKSSTTKNALQNRKLSSATASAFSTSESTRLLANPKIIMNQLRDVAKENPSVLPVIGNGAYMFLVSGFLMTDMLQLRVALVGGYAGLVAFHTLHQNPLKIPLRWSALFVVVNAGAAVLLAMDQFGAPLSEQEEALYKTHFSRLTRGQFYQLLCMGKRQETPSGTVLTEEGQVSKKLYFIEQGKAKVYHHGAFAAYVDQGGFVNDIAFQQGQEAESYGTIITDSDCSIIVWDTTELREHLKNRSDMDRNTQYLLSEHLMKSLLKQREARRWNQMQQQNTAQTQTI